jgi:uncharacterized protein with PQ loop repeat
MDTNIIDLLILICASFTYLLLIISPHHRMNEIIKKHNSDEYNVIPFIGMLINSFSWFFYTLHIKTYPLIFLNCIAIGYILHNLMIISFYSTKEKEMRYIREALCLFVPIELIIYALSCTIFKKNIEMILGTQLMIVGIIYKFTHISKICKIIQEKNSKIIDTYFTILSFINALLWGLYYIFIKYDIYLIIWSAVSLFILFILLICKILYYKNENLNKEQDIELGNT